MSNANKTQGFLPISDPISAIIRNSTVLMITRLHLIAADRSRPFSDRVAATRESEKVWISAVSAGFLDPFYRPWIGAEVTK